MFERRGWQQDVLIVDRPCGFEPQRSAPTQPLNWKGRPLILVRGWHVRQKESAITESARALVLRMLGHAGGMCSEKIDMNKFSSSSVVQTGRSELGLSKHQRTRPTTRGPKSVLGLVSAPWQTAAPCGPPERLLLAVLSPLARRGRKPASASARKRAWLVPRTCRWLASSVSTCAFLAPTNSIEKKNS